MFNNYYAPCIDVPNNDPPLGKMVSILLAKDTYFPGEIIQGRIMLQLKDPLQFPHIQLQLKQMKGCVMDLSSKTLLTNSINTTLYDSCIDIEPKFKRGNQLYELPPSSYQFPITIQLNNELLHSFEILIKSKGYGIRYVLSIEIPALNHYPILSSNIILIKSKPHPLQSPLHLSSCANVHTWGLDDQGTTIMAISYPKNNYKYLDSIPLTVSINNSRGQLTVESIKVYIMKEVKIFNASNEKLYDNTTEIFKYEFPIRCNSGQRVKQLIQVRFEDSEDTQSRRKYPESKNRMFLMESLDDNMIKCNYSLRVECNYDAMVNKSTKPLVIVPIWMTSISEEEDNAKSVVNLEKDKEKVRNKEIEDIEEALKRSKIDYEKENEERKRMMVNEDEQSLNEQIMAIDYQCSLRENKTSRDSGRPNQSNSRPNQYIDYEKGITNNSNKREEGQSNFFINFLNEIDKEKEERRSKEVKQSNNNNSNQDIFCHNSLIINQIGNIEAKLKEYSHKGEQNGNNNKQPQPIIDINAL